MVLRMLGSTKAGVMLGYTDINFTAGRLLWLAALLI